MSGDVHPDGLGARADTEEQTPGDFRDTAVGTAQSKTQKENKTESARGARPPWDSLAHLGRFVIEVPEGEMRWDAQRHSKI